MTAAPRILVVDDEANLRRVVTSYLEAEGYLVATAADGAAALAEVRRQRPDLVVLDVAMPGMDGIEALREMRTFSDTYVIMLTARADETDKLIGLSVGADDYMTKPFSPRELVARVKAVLRRARNERTDVESGRMTFKDLTIDVPRHLVLVADRECDVTALEFGLLVALASQPRRVFSRRQLIEAVWGWDYFGDERVVDVHIRSLRKALGDSAADPTVIGTVRGVGYRFLPDPL